MIKIGTSEIIQQNILIGETPVIKVFVGDNLVWQKITPINLGFLYNRHAITSAKGFAPVGWHIGTFNDNNLITYQDPAWGDYNTQGDRVKTTGTGLWEGTNEYSTNSLKLNLKPSGWRPGIFSGHGRSHFFWIEWWDNSSSSKNASYNTRKLIGATHGTSYTVGLSVRLIKDSTNLVHGESGTMKGNDNKIYPTICIGTLEIMAENSAETKYRDGSWIMGFDDGVYTPISDAAWAVLTTGALCALDDLLTNV